ncbi:hypothetical protein [Acetobacter papayae]|uniref:hypothetical protein n=1 Tax=Acetobacter papayae TaxID=1076592 RepID=UPI00131F0032|nr:hypothetical protein [Acetobacter papayae]
MEHGTACIEDTGLHIGGVFCQAQVFSTERCKKDTFIRQIYFYACVSGRNIKPEP